MDINSVVSAAMKNRKHLEGTEKAGCYHCLSVFDTKDIKSYTDNGETALCPQCNVDCVIPSSSSNPITVGFLEKARNYWF